jgi:hypothetical protein
LRVNSAQPPCRYRCALPSGWCEGHRGLAHGDCEEVLGLEHDIINKPEHHVDYPATYDAWSGNTNGVFKAPGARPSLAVTGAGAGAGAKEEAWGGALSDRLVENKPLAAPSQLAISSF